MLSHRSAAILLFVVLCAGCQSTFSPRSISRSLGYRESHSARENPVDQSSDPWIQEMGTVTREEHNPEKILDPLKLRNYFVSSKARDIESNLGVGE